MKIYIVCGHNIYYNEGNNFIDSFFFIMSAHDSIKKAKLKIKKSIQEFLQGLKTSEWIYYFTLSEKYLDKIDIITNKRYKFKDTFYNKENNIYNLIFPFDLSIEESFKIYNLLKLDIFFITEIELNS